MQHTMMPKYIGLNLTGIANVKSTARRNKLATITNLTTRLRIKRRLVEHDNRDVTCLNYINRGTVLVDGDNTAI